jgi:formamidopyrimidine-DNA glycosylase
LPELPEVETMVRGIRPYVEGRKLTALKRCRCKCKPISITPSFPTLAKRVRETTILTVRRLAKRVVLDLSSGDSIVIEPRMTGLMLLSDPPDREHLRLEWQFAGKRKFNSIWFWDRRGLGTIRLFSAEELTEHLGPNRLGPDALKMTLNQLRDRCKKTRRPIKVALMDQKLTAGIGNLYASEILHLAQIDPAKPAEELKHREIRKLHSAVQKILNEAIRHEGSTLGDATYRNALNQNGNYQNMHRVYKREGEPCVTCSEAPIQRIVQAQRSTFYCPACQK